jgi:hypothetical protein
MDNLEISNFSNKDFYDLLLERYVNETNKITSCMKKNLFKNNFYFKHRY